MHRWSSPNASRCWRRCSPAVSISGLAARPEPTAPQLTRCAAGSIGARATISWSGLHELTLWETRDFPSGHPYNNVVAMPDDTPLPPIWLLGSSDYSSELAAQVGMGFAFAHHFAMHDAVDAMVNYRTNFKPSGWRTTPHAILAVAIVTAETDAEAERLASSMDLNRLRRDRGQFAPLPSPDEALAYPYTDAERASIARNRSRLFVGSPATVMQKLQPMISASQADELMIITAVYDHDARRKSYSLLADAFGLGKKAAAGGCEVSRASKYPPPSFRGSPQG